MYRLNYKKWVIPTLDKSLAMQIGEECGIDNFTALLLTSRGMTDPLDIEEFLSDEPMLSDPFEYKDMLPAVERINRAVDNFEKIAIFGDYDCDGITATALLYDYLKKANADVIYYVPNRSEGYGMNSAAIDSLKSQGVSLIITVDNGISAVDEIAYASSLKIDTVVTDHHLVGDVLPSAVAVIDPHRPDCPCEFKDLAGVGVAFKLVCALSNKQCEEMLEEYADLVTIGTIADVMPLCGENRSIVKYGIGMIEHSKNVGISELLSAVGYADKALSAISVAFTIAPRLNAAGRMGESGRGVRLLCESDPQIARSLAEELCTDNIRRQQTEAEIAEAACKEIDSNCMQYDRVIVVCGENWHHGVVGIAASKLVEKYGRPVIILSSDGVSAVGSGRSVEGFDLFDAIKSCENMLIRYGGHTLAAGMTIKRELVDEFRAKINKYAAENYPDMPFPKLSLDCKLNPAGVSIALADVIGALAPFGKNNPVPLFGLFGMKIENIQPMGGGKHLRIFLSKNGAMIRCVMFGKTPDDFPFDKDDTVDIAVVLEKNLWQGDEHLSIQIRDIRPSGTDDDFYNSIRLYEKFKCGEGIADASKLLIERGDAAAVFRLVRGEREGKILLEKLVAKLCGSLSYAKILLSADVLCELSVLKTDGKYLCLGDTSVKVDLDSSDILKKIKMCVK